MWSAGRAIARAGAGAAATATAGLGLRAISIAVSNVQEQQERSRSRSIAIGNVLPFPVVAATTFHRVQKKGCAGVVGGGGIRRDSALSRGRGGEPVRGLVIKATVGRAHFQCGILSATRRLSVTLIYLSLRPEYGFYSCLRGISMSSVQCLSFFLSFFFRVRPTLRVKWDYM